MDFELRVADESLKRSGFFALDAQQANKGLVREFAPPTVTM